MNNMNQNLSTIVHTPDIEVISLEVNKANMFKNLADTFSNGTKVLSELLQNARRAGAKTIQITSVSNTLTFEDDGHGIEDFHKLFVHSESGWNEETTATEKAFGIGFFSSLYCAKQVQVESRGRQCLVDTAKTIQHMQPITVTKTDYIGNTRISLIDFTLPEDTISMHLASIVKGFSVPVFFNGIELDRPHAIDQLSQQYELFQLECGTALIRNASTNDPSTKNWVMYFQGLPIATPKGCSDDDYFHSNANIMHLDNSFKVRTPDRDCLLEQEVASVRINTALSKFWQTRLATLKIALSPEDFVGFYGVMRKFSCLELLNDIEILPKKAINMFIEYPRKTSYWRNSYRRYSDENDCLSTEHITKSQVESGKSKFVTNLEATPDQFEHGLKTLMYKEKWFYVRDNFLHPDHWIFTMSLNAKGVELHFDGKLLVEGPFCSNAFSSVVKVMETFTITIGDQTFSYDVENPICFAIPDENDCDNCTIIECGYSNDNAIEQMCYYETDDVFNEAWLDEETESFINNLAILRGENFTTTVAKALTSFNIHNKSNCQSTASVCLISDMSSKVVALNAVIASYLTKLGVTPNADDIDTFVTDQLKLH